VAGHLRRSRRADAEKGKKETRIPPRGWPEVLNGGLSGWRQGRTSLRRSQKHQRRDDEFQATRCPEGAEGWALITAVAAGNRRLLWRARLTMVAIRRDARGACNRHKLTGQALGVCSSMYAAFGLGSCSPINEPWGEHPDDRRRGRRTATSYGGFTQACARESSEPARQRRGRAPREDVTRGPALGHTAEISTGACAAVCGPSTRRPVLEHRRAEQQARPAPGGPGVNVRRNTLSQRGWR